MDDMRASVRMNVPDAVTVLASWSRRYESCAVMGLLDEDDVEIPVAADQLARLTSLIHRPLPSGALRLAYPDAHNAGSVLLRVPVDEPEWARVADHVQELVAAGLYVSDDDIRDAIWVVLEACGLPNGAIAVRRLELAPELPDDPVFAPVTLFERFDGSGNRTPWARAAMAMPTGLEARAVSVMVSELAEREERQLSQRNGEPTVLSEAVIRI